MTARRAQSSLHIGNGDTLMAQLRATAVPGDLLAWRDSLHEGPVPALALRRLSARRARYLASAYPQLDRRALAREFTRRDAQLRTCGRYAELVLWFEHDLYDQLQLLQILAWLAANPPQSTRLSMICIDRFAGVTPFHGLGQLSPSQLMSLFPRREPVSAAQLALASAGWHAFTAPDPAVLQAFCASDLAALPFLRAALIRWLQEYPSRENGLARSLQQILQLVADGEQRPGRLFAAHQRLEEAPFMGNWSFWRCIRRLCAGAQPLLLCNGGAFRPPAGARPDAAFLAQRLRLTASGAAVLAGRRDWLALCPPGTVPDDDWLGGVQLGAPHGVWRWDRTSARLCPP